MTYVLRGVLLIFGLVVMALGINVGFGGIATLGWQGSGAFLAVTDPALFAVRDSHVRFIGGVWLALGLLLVAGSVAFARLRSVLVTLMAMIFVGGLARLFGGISPEVLPSLGVELVAAPLLGWWISRTGSLTRGGLADRFRPTTKRRAESEAA